jgi:cell division septation protein DedD
MARDGRGGLGLGDRLILLVAWVTTCGFVYLLGFYVGKSTQAQSLRVEQQLLRLPVTSPPPPEGQRPKAAPEFGFYDKLMGERGAEHPPDKGHAEAKAAPPAAPAPARQVAAAPAAEPVARPSAARPAPPAAVASKGPPRPLHPTAEVPERRRPAPAPTASAAPASPAPPPAALATGGFTVRTTPTRDREEADGLTKQLRSRGYDATLVRLVRDGDTMYRVQIGRFASAEQAGETMHRLREHEGVAHAFVASE